MNQGLDDVIQAQAVLTEAQFRALVCAICHRRISRTWFWKLREELGITPDDFTDSGARAMAFFVQLRKKRIPAYQARQRTVQFIRSNNL